MLVLLISASVLSMLLPFKNTVNDKYQLRWMGTSDKSTKTKYSRIYKHFILGTQYSVGTVHDPRVTQCVFQLVSLP